MKGFKDSTKVQYSKGGDAKGTKGAAKVSKVMGEFKSGALHSGSKKGPEVTNPKQAVAIALSEARKAGAKIPVKKADGGYIGSRRPTKADGSYLTDEDLGIEREKPRSVTVERTTVRTDKGRALPPRPVEKSKGSFRSIPLVGAAMDAMGLKKGGLAVMPKGKKC